MTEQLSTALRLGAPQNIQTLDRSVVVTLIDSITVYSKDDIAVCFQHQDEILEMMALAEIQSESRKEIAL